jgi:hypothetical protein
MPVALKLWQHTRGFVPVAEVSEGRADWGKNLAATLGDQAPDLLEALREGKAS